MNVAVRFSTFRIDIRCGAVYDGEAVRLPEQVRRLGQGGRGKGD